MIGFVTTQEKANHANDAISAAQISRGAAVFWLAGSYLIYSGEFEGSYFIPCDDDILLTPLAGTPPLTPQDYPEITSIISELGGMDARIDISFDDITCPIPD